MADVDLTYDVGTASIAADGTVVTLTGAILADINIKQWDAICIDPANNNILVPITHVDVALAQLTIPEWNGGAKTNVPYVVYQLSPLRYTGAKSLADVDAMLAALNTEGWYRYINPAYADPTAAGLVANEGQFAFKYTTGQLWIMSGGTWQFVGIYKGFSAKGAWSNATAYSINDVVSYNGSSYIAVQSGTNHLPTDTAWWMLLAAKGDIGPATLKPLVAWTTATAYAPGPPADYVSINGSSYACVVAHTSAASFATDLAAGRWVVVALKGADAPVYGGTSTTSLAIGTGLKTFVTQNNLAYAAFGSRVRAVSAANPNNYMEGIASYSGTSLAITVTRTNGTGTFADWNFTIAGDPGLGSGDMLAANNLSDVSSIVMARLNLGISGINTISGVKDYGAKGDGKSVTATVTIAAGSNALTATGASFTADDVGKLISVPGAGTAGRPLLTKIAGFTDATHISLVANAVVAVSAVSKLIQYATDDTAAINSMITAVGLGAEPFVYFPKGFYGITTLNTVNAGSWQGSGRLTSVLQSFSDTGDIVNFAGTAMLWRDLGLTCAGIRMSGVSLKLSGNHCQIQNFDITNYYVGLHNTGVLNQLSIGNINVATSRAVAANSGCILNTGTILSMFGVGMGSGTTVAADMAEFGIRCQVGEVDATQCFVFLVNHGGLADPGANQTVLGIDLKGCWFDSTLTSGFKAAGTATTSILQLIWATDCWFGPGFAGGASYAFIADNSANGSLARVWLCNNYFVSYNHGNGVGIYLAGGSAGVIETNISNNTIGGATQSFNTGLQVLAVTHNWNFVGNAVNFCTLGFNIASGCVNFIIANNRFLNNSGFTNNSISQPNRVIVNNVGYKLSGAGEVVQTPDGSGLVTIAHGLNAAPNIWTGQCRDTGFIQVQPYSADATNIRFIVFQQNGAPATGSRIIQWRADNVV